MNAPRSPLAQVLRDRLPAIVLPFADAARGSVLVPLVEWAALGRPEFADDLPPGYPSA